MNMRNTLLGVMTMLLLMSVSLAFGDTISWNFEDGNDHGFKLWCIRPADGVDNDDDIAGDESVTGCYDPIQDPIDDNAVEGQLPVDGLAWCIGVPNEWDGYFSVAKEGCHEDPDDPAVLKYLDCNDPFAATEDDITFDFVNGRGQSGYLNTYALNQWGDKVHYEDNDQIATSPQIKLGENAVLTVWAVGNTGASWAGVRTAPILDEANPDSGYTNGSGGIAVLTPDRSTLLDTLDVKAEGVGDEQMPDEFTLDLSALAGQTVIIEVVDAFHGGWGWYAIDEIQITNATLAETGVASEPTTAPSTIALMQNYPNPFNPSTNIQFQTLKDGHVKVSVFNTLGQPVATLMDQKLTSGMHQVTFDAANFSTGIYYYRIEVDGYSEMKKMMLLK
ncbi:T9SS type A sorting domain-containing protein [candidate division KSB1 bacterium]|nr:T9SS type A sorting domain-containing protein [candidate division KSB1 bacterium]